MAVDVGVADFIRSYIRLHDAGSNTVVATAHLLHSRSIEYGLKAAYLGKMGVNARSSQDLPQVLRAHNLRKLAKQLRLDGSRPQQFSACRRAHSYEFDVEHQDLRQGWRNGASLSADDDERAVRALSDLVDSCGKGSSRVIAESAPRSLTIFICWSTSKSISPRLPLAGSGSSWLPEIDADWDSFELTVTDRTDAVAVGE